MKKMILVAIFTLCASAQAEDGLWGFRIGPKEFEARTPEQSAVLAVMNAVPGYFMFREGMQARIIYRVTCVQNPTYRISGPSDFCFVGAGSQELAEEKIEPKNPVTFLVFKEDGKFIYKGSKEGFDSRLSLNK